MQRSMKKNMLTEIFIVYDIKSKSTQKLTSSVSVWEYAWNHQGTEIAAAMSDKNLVDDSYMFKRIFIVNAFNGVKVEVG
jgi:PIN domain nuclease of toxin-antitoxin system